MSSYFVGERAAYLLIHQRKSGRIYLGQFDHAKSADFSVVSIRRAVRWKRLAPTTRLYALPNERRELPAPQDWTLWPNQAVIESKSNDQLVVIGDSSGSGYQLRSPRIPVPQEADIEIKLPVERLVGNVEVGVLPGSEVVRTLPGGKRQAARWLVKPNYPSSSMKFNSGEHKSIWIVVVNSQDQGLKMPTKFRVEQGHMQYRPGIVSELDKIHYTDILTTCRRRMLGQEKPEHIERIGLFAQLIRCRGNL